MLKGIWLGAAASHVAASAASHSQLGSQSQGGGFKGQFAVETSVFGDLQELQCREELGSEGSEGYEGPEGYQEVCFIYLHLVIFFMLFIQKFASPKFLLASSPPGSPSCRRARIHGTDHW